MDREGNRVKTSLSRQVLVSYNGFWGFNGVLGKINNNLDTCVYVRITSNTLGSIPGICTVSILEKTEKTVQPLISFNST